MSFIRCSLFVVRNKGPNFDGSDGEFGLGLCNFFILFYLLVML